jgi:uncharacterized membrane protein
MGCNPAVPGRVTQQTSSDSSENKTNVLEEDLGWCGVVLGLVVRMAGEPGKTLQDIGAYSDIWVYSDIRIYPDTGVYPDTGSHPKIWEYPDIGVYPDTG